MEVWVPGLGSKNRRLPPMDAPGWEECRFIRWHKGGPNRIVIQLRGKIHTVTQDTVRDGLCAQCLNPVRGFQNGHRGMGSRFCSKECSEALDVRGSF